MDTKGYEGSGHISFAHLVYKKARFLRSYATAKIHRESYGEGKVQLFVAESLPRAAKIVDLLLLSTPIRS